MNKKMHTFGLTLIAAIHVICVSAAIAGPLKAPNAFTRGTPAVAGEVNDNFAAVEVAVNDNDTRIVAVAAENAALLARVATLETVNTELVSANDELGARLAELETFLDDLRGVLSLQNDNQGNPAVVFSGVNLHVNNGEGATDSINGLGNLVLGYDEPTPSGTPICSDGAFDNESDCIANGEQFAEIHKSGSHTLVIGPEHNYSRSGGLVAGRRNTVTGPQSSITGGISNRASGLASSVAGGSGNTALAGTSTVSGGISNTTDGGAVASSIAGGRQNTTRGSFSSVSGGQSNSADELGSTVGGGLNRVAQGPHSWVAGSLVENN